MMTDTHVAERPNTQRKPIEAYYLGDDDKVSFFNVYLEFILFWTQTDAESYRNASMMTTTSEEKDLLMSMVVRKTEMFDVFSAYRTNGYKDWFESVFSNKTSASEFVLENQFKSLQGLKDTFHFAYQKEYESLDMFEKVNRSNKESTIHNLFESAVEHQRQHILYLDSRLFDITRFTEPKPVYSTLTMESTGKKWTLMWESK
jgi:rubrerythrin